MNTIHRRSVRRGFLFAPEYGGNVVSGGGHPADSNVSPTEQIDDTFGQDQRGHGKTPGVGVPGSQNNPVSEDAGTRTSRRAYEMWEGDGRPDGRSEEYWLRAEEESRGTESAPVSDEQK